MAGKIFINYRRGDDAGFTQALYMRLEDEFGTGDLFMDVEGHIKPGDDFVAVLGRQVAAADVILVVIGPRWSELLAKRQGDTEDFVAVEIKAALDQGKRVIPILVGGAGVPRAETLPEAIRALARRNAVGLRPDRFKADCQGLIAAVKESLASAEQERAARTEAERQAAEKARLEAEVQAAARAKATEERGREQAAAGLSAEEIRKAEELANWEFVKDRKDIQDLRDHLARFPNGTTQRYSLARLDELVWAALGGDPETTQLRAYLNEFPKGTNAAAAQERIMALERNADEARAAEQRRSEETAEWARIATSTNTSEIEAFIKQWPKGQHTSAADARLQELRRSKRSGFGAAVDAGYGRYLDFSGRSSRHEFWFFTLFLFIALFVCGLLDISLGFKEAGPLQVLVLITTLVPSISVSVRRLHDIGRSGWWYLLAFIPFVGWIVLIYWCCQPSEQATNTYGNSPLTLGDVVPHPA